MPQATIGQAQEPADWIRASRRSTTPARKKLLVLGGLPTVPTERLQEARATPRHEGQVGEESSMVADEEEEVAPGEASPGESDDDLLAPCDHGRAAEPVDPKAIAADA